MPNMTTVLMGRASVARPLQWRPARGVTLTGMENTSAPQSLTTSAAAMTSPAPAAEPAGPVESYAPSPSAALDKTQPSVPVETPAVSPEAAPVPAGASGGDASGNADEHQPGEQAPVAEEAPKPATDAEVKKALDAVSTAVAHLREVTTGRTDPWGVGISTFAKETRRALPKMPSLRDLDPEQLTDAVGQWASVDFAKVPGVYLIIAVDAEAGKATVVLPVKGISLSVSLSTVHPDPAYPRVSMPGM